MTLILICIITVYYILLVYSAEKFSKIKETQNIQTIEPTTTFSIIVPYRNEYENLPKLLEGLRQIQYPADKMEVIFCDDHSNDDGFILLQTASQNFTRPHPHSSME